MAGTRIGTRLALATLAAPCLATAAWAGWNIQEVDAPHHFFSSAVLVSDPSGLPAIAYGASSLEFARWTGSTWTIDTIDTSPGFCSTFYDRSAAFDSLGNAAVAYIFGDPGATSLRFARWSGTA